MTKKMIALKEFPFRGVPVKVDQEIQPDNKEQGDLLEKIGLAKYKKFPPYRNRSAQPARTAVMQTSTAETGNG